MKIENICVTGFGAALRGMRNAKNSWHLSDSVVITIPHPKDEENMKEFEKFIDINSLYDPETKNIGFIPYKCGENGDQIMINPYFNKYLLTCNDVNGVEQNYRVDSDHIILIGEKDLKLAKSLTRAGSSHCKYLRDIIVSFDLVASFNFWKQFDTYCVGVTKNSCSTMHKITSKPIEDEDFCNLGLREKDIAKRREWIEYLQEVYDDETLSDTEKTIILSNMNLLCYEQRRTVTLNYEVLRRLYNERRFHKLENWKWLCNEIIINFPYFKELCIIEKEKN